MSSDNCKGSTSVVDVLVIVGATGVTILTSIGDFGNSDEELEVCHVLDSVKRDCFCWLGVASGDKGGLLVVLRE